MAATVAKTSYTAPPELIASVQRWRQQHPGRPTADLIRAGLASYDHPPETGDDQPERLRAIEHALTGISHQLTGIAQTLATLPESRMSAEQIEQGQHDVLAERVAIWHRELCQHAPDDLVFTARSAMLAGDWTSTTSARQRLDLLANHGLAVEIEASSARGNPRQWQLRPPDEAHRGLPKR